MEILIAFIIVILLIAVMFTAIGSVIAYYDGKSAVTDYYGRYDNSYWMPVAYAYEVGYRRYEDKKYVTLEVRNKKRFNRE